MDGALSRIEASRSRLKAVMMPPPPEPSSREDTWFDRLTAIPIVGAVIDSVGTWWSRHPARPAAEMAAEATTAAVKPIAVRHPYAFVLAAAILGALFTWARPWRWAFRSALFAGLIPQLASKAVSSMPVESWMSIFGTAPPRAPASPVGEPAGMPATG